MDVSRHCAGKCSSDGCGIWRDTNFCFVHLRFVASGYHIASQCRPGGRAKWLDDRRASHDRDNDVVEQSRQCECCCRRHGQHDSRMAVLIDSVADATRDHHEAVPMTIRLYRQYEKRRGATIVEGTIVLLILTSFIFGGLELGLAVMRYNTLCEGAR